MYTKQKSFSAALIWKANIIKFSDEIYRLLRKNYRLNNSLQKIVLNKIHRAVKIIFTKIEIYNMYNIGPIRVNTSKFFSTGANLICKIINIFIDMQYGKLFSNSKLNF